jgi:hypothetical protein
VASMEFVGNQPTSVLEEDKMHFKVRVLDA